MEPIPTALGRFVAETEAGAISAEVRGHAALVVADTLGAILAGSAAPEIRRLQLTAPVLGSRGAEAAWALCEALEGLKDARELADGLRALETGR
ncbi:MAG: hypothetical protein HY002_02345 [Candidatus Rokubacteria bacterium]|nr:hypothetical protein [Candidatus Rokubacteria bacterium]